MEAHVERLKRLCRVCGQKIVVNRGYVNPKSCEEYVVVLRHYYGILYENENKEVCVCQVVFPSP